MRRLCFIDVDLHPKFNYSLMNLSTLSSRPIFFFLHTSVFFLQVFSFFFFVFSFRLNVGFVFLILWFIMTCGLVICKVCDLSCFLKMNFLHLNHSLELSVCIGTTLEGPTCIIHFLGLCSKDENVLGTNL